MIISNSFASHVDMDRVASILREAAAAILVPIFEDPEKRKPKIKQDGTLLTAADGACEEFLETRLKQLLPGSEFLGEETLAKNPGVFQKLRDSGNVWVVDPIDGTKRFAEGSSRFGVLVSLVRQGELIASWIYLPVHEEGQNKSQMIVAQQMAGVTLNGERVRLSHKNFDLSDICGYYNIKRLEESLFWDVNHRIKTHRRMESDPCSAWSFYCFLKGEKDIYLHTHLNPWDTSAGAFACREAGAFSRLIGGDQYDVSCVQGALLHAPNEDSWKMAREMLFPKLLEGQIALPSLNVQTGQAYPWPKYDVRL